MTSLPSTCGHLGTQSHSSLVTEAHRSGFQSPSRLVMHAQSRPVTPGRAQSCTLVMHTRSPSLVTPSHARSRSPSLVTPSDARSRPVTFPWSHPVTPGHTPSIYRCLAFFFARSPHPTHRPPGFQNGRSALGVGFCGWSRSATALLRSGTNIATGVCGAERKAPERAGVASKAPFTEN